MGICKVDYNGLTVIRSFIQVIILAMQQCTVVTFCESRWINFHTVADTELRHALSQRSARGSRSWSTLELSMGTSTLRNKGDGPHFSNLVELVALLYFKSSFFMETNNTGSINLNPSKSELFTGTCNFVVINRWLYKFYQYFNIMKSANGNVILTDENCISLSRSPLTGIAAIWWYTILKGILTVQTLDEFSTAIRREIVPEDHELRTRDTWKTCKQTSSVAEYLLRLPNIVLTIPDMTQSEKWVEFVSDLSLKVQFKVFESQLLWVWGSHENFHAHWGRIL